MKAWQVGGIEKEQYIFLFFSASGGESSGSCIFTMVPGVLWKDFPSLVVTPY